MRSIRNRDRPALELLDGGVLASSQLPAYHRTQSCFIHAVQRLKGARNEERDPVDHEDSSFDGGNRSLFVGFFAGWHLVHTERRPIRLPDRPRGACFLFHQSFCRDHILLVLVYQPTD